jgi:hypothetical protein
MRRSNTVKKLADAASVAMSRPSVENEMKATKTVARPAVLSKAELGGRCHCLGYLNRCTSDR